jgi:GTP-binding protein
MFADTANIEIKAGKGGDGRSSFLHEKYRAMGGPDGGDGGRGGDIIFRVDHNMNTLSSYRTARIVRGGDGEAGGGNRMHGSNGADVVVHLPQGTQVWEDGNVVIDLAGDGQEVIMAKGGRGGFGNAHFKSSTRQAPRTSELGERGEQHKLQLELKMVADVGLVGLPNAGKSTLLSVISNAKPEIADYPFTTLVPNLGVVDIDDYGFLVADIPGLIEGAAEGAGLGHEFLAHIERCAMLVHLVDMAPMEGEPVEAYETVRGELAAHGAGLERLPELVVLTKRDLVEAGQAESLRAEWAGRLGDTVLGVMTVSSATGEGLDDLRARILTELPETPLATATAPGEPVGEFEAEHRVYRPAGEGGYWVEQEEDGAFRVAGRGVELLFERHDTKNEEALAYLEQRLGEIGVLAALTKAGFQAGDDVRIGEHEFELHI